MAGWFRVFMLQEVGPEPSSIMEQLQMFLPQIQGKFRADEDGWFQLVLSHASLGELILDHFLSSEKGVRAELNTWAAWFESKQRLDLMERIIQVKQILSFEVTPELEENVTDPSLFKKLSMVLAALGQGFIHIDGIGFIEADGSLLIEDENPAEIGLK